MNTRKPCNTQRAHAVQRLRDRSLQNPMFVEGPIKARTILAADAVPTIGLSGTYGFISDGKPIKDEPQ